MKNIKQIGAILIAIMVSFTSIGMAQDQEKKKAAPPSKEERGMKQKAMREELDKFQIEKVTPKMREYRDKLDKTFSAQDLQKVVALRRQMAAMKSNANKKKPMTGSAEERERHAKVMREDKQKQRADIDKKIGEITNKYSAEIDNVMKEVSASKEQWKVEKEKIREKHGVKGNYESRGQMDRSVKGPGQGREQNKGGQEHNHSHKGGQGHNHNKGEQSQKGNLTDAEKANKKRIRFILEDPAAKQMKKQKK